MRQLTVLLILLGAVVGLYLLLGQDYVRTTTTGGGPDAGELDESDQTAPGLVGSAPHELLSSDPSPLGSRTIRVRVVDPTHTPHAGVEVVLNRSAEDERWSESLRFTPTGFLQLRVREDREDWDPVAKATSDAEGRVQFEGLEAGVPYVAVATPAPPLHPGHAWIDGGRNISGFRVPSGHETKLVLAAGVPLRVRVVDDEGAGVPARVQLDGWIEPKEGAKYWSTQTESTDLAGRLRFDAVPRGPLRATVYVVGHGVIGPIPVTAPSEEEVRLLVGVPGGAVLHGVIRDLRGEGVPNAVVLLGLRATPKDGPRHVRRLVRSGEDGHYRIGGLPAGRVSGLSVGADGYLLRRNLANDLSLSAGEERGLDIVLPRAARIEGDVRDESGAPVSGARVRADMGSRRSGVFQTFEPLPAFSDAQGRFQLVAVPPGTGTVVAQKTGYAHMPDPASAAARYAIEAPGQTVRASVVLRRGVPVSGIVVDADDAPVVGAEVVAGVKSGNDAWSLGQQL